MPGKKREKVKFKYSGMCLPIVFIAITLACIGLVMVMSATYNSTLISDYNANLFAGIDMQVYIGILGIVVMFLVARVAYHWFTGIKFLRACLISVIVLLFLVKFTPLGKEVYGSRRWINLGSLSFQPSELAKFISAMYIAKFVSLKPWWYKDKKCWMHIILVAAIPAGLIIIEPDLSTTILYFLTVLAVLFVAGMPKKALAIGGIGVAGLLPLIMLFTDYHERRIAAWLNPWADPKDKGYQIIQSLYAIGDGGLVGVGLGNSKQKITHLPMSDTDYIFSIICEEFGFVGAILVVGLYVAYGYFGIKIAMEASDSLGAYIAVGVTAVVICQAFLNMAVATNIFPSTGVTLPFISRGATSLGVFLAGTGILLSVSSHKAVRHK